MNKSELKDHKIEQLAMMVEELATQLDKANSEVTELRGLVKRIADNQLKAAETTLETCLVLDQHTYELKRLQRLTEPKKVIDNENI